MARKILLADDSVTAQSMGRRILCEAGYEVVTVNNGSAALKKIAEQLPDLLILDVYMPGYGGLEVCQRLKGTEDTARIPVLLTVGKLEPFKADEARRVRADAYLVKPFEASELLAALVKLEDKIVPRAETPAHASFAKALAEMEEQTSRGGRKKGAAKPDTSWKDRLSIPGALKKRAEPESAESEPAHGTGFRDFSRREEPAASKQAAPAAEHVSEGLLRGITAEEIAAITAAAAAFGGHPDSGASEAPAPPAAVEAAATAPEPVAEEAEAAVESGSDSVPAAITPAEEPAAAMATEESESAEAEGIQAASAYLAAITGAVHVEEVPALPEMQPVQSFAPPEGDGVMAAIWNSAGDSAVPEPEPVHAHAEAGVPAAPVRPRWIAEEVPLTDGEAADLEYEMQKARAAMAEEAAGAGIASSQAEETVPAPVSEDSAPAAAEVVSAAEPEPAPEFASSDSSAGESIAATQPEMTVAAAAETAAEPTSVEELPVAEAVASESVAEPAQESPSLAAAAAAGAGVAGSADSSSAVVPAPAPETDSQPVISGDNSANDPQVQEHEAELAQAWAQWRQIRESIASPQMASHLADAAAAELHASQSAAEQPHSENDSSSNSAGPDAIASIVDSVLSELKPKIVEEIAKKLGQKK